MKANRLLTLMGTRELARQQHEQTMAELRQTPGVSGETIDKLEKLSSFDQMIGIVVEVYVKHFDEPTLDAVIQFAETPAGKLWFAKQPTIQQESFEASVRWGRELTEKLK